MPRGDRTGPWGMGPRTGRAAGFCSGFPGPGYLNRAGGWFGRGGRWARGGWSNFFAPPYPAPSQSFPTSDAQAEAEALKEEAEALRNTLKAIEERLKELEGK